MTAENWDRLLDARRAFDDPVTLVVTVVLATVLALTPAIIWLLARLGRVDTKLRGELMARYWSWLVITPLILVPILLGALWTILSVGILSLLCYREYARATGLFREKTISIVVVLSILAVTFAVLDHWYRLFVALVPFTIGILAIAAILRDEPKGYIQRIALGIFGFALFGSCLGHLGYLANDRNYRPLLILVFLSVELNDVFAFMVGKTLGKRKLAPNTSPKKTIAGAVGAVVLTTLLVIGVGWSIFQNMLLAAQNTSLAAKNMPWTVQNTPWTVLAHLTVLGLLISVLGQFGDLMLSSIKRDLGIKDMATTIPGHGGLLDRFDSIILVAPAVFHYINYFVGVETEANRYVLTGG